MDPESNPSIPLRLRDKRHVVFGNLPEIYKFHERWFSDYDLQYISELFNCSMFSVALEEYEDRPEKVGECFLKFVSPFTLAALQLDTMLAVL